MSHEADYAHNWWTQFVAAVDALGVEQMSLAEMRRAMKHRDEGVSPGVAARKQFGNVFQREK